MSRAELPCRGTAMAQRSAQVAGVIGPHLRQAASSRRLWISERENAVADSEKQATDLLPHLDTLRQG